MPRGKTMLRTSKNTSANIKNDDKKNDTQNHCRPSSKKKSSQQLVLSYTDQNRILLANLVKAYSILRYELSSAFLIGISIPIGYKSHFAFFGLNPLTLTEEQSKKHPTLLLHGACHNQGVWLYLAKALQNAHLGPLFTVNFSPVMPKKKSFDIIYNKIIEIQKIYREWNRESVSINLIGYSLGAALAYFINLDKNCWNFNTSGLPMLGLPPRIKNPNIHLVICIGSRIRPSISNIYEMVGEEDVLVPPVLDERLQSKGKQLTIECGHLSLIHSPILYDHIIQILSQNENIKSLSTPAMQKATMSKKDSSNENEFRVTQQKKYGCLHRFFSNSKYELRSSYAKKSKHLFEASTSSCRIL
jgi:hypothetical protein